jgi:hypothetical protein
VYVGDADDIATYVWALIKLCLMLVVGVEWVEYLGPSTEHMRKV